jgi:hypothetical protein
MRRLQLTASSDSTRTTAYEQSACYRARRGEQGREDSHAQFDRHYIVSDVGHSCRDQQRSRGPSQHEGPESAWDRPATFSQSTPSEIGHDQGPESDRGTEALVSEIASRVANAQPKLVTVTGAECRRKYSQGYPHEPGIPERLSRHAGCGPMSRLLRARRTISSRRRASARATDRPSGVNL